MELKLKAYSPSTDYLFEYGTLILKNNILLEFIEDENIKFLKDQYGEHYFPIKSKKYDAIFLDESDEQYKNFDAKINIDNSLPIYFYVKLTPTEKQQLKWMNKKYWIQIPDNTWKFIVFAIGTILAVIGLLYTT